MPEFKPGTREEVESGAAQFTYTETFINEGSPAPIVPNKTSSMVGQVRRGSRVFKWQELVYIIRLLYIQ